MELGVPTCRKAAKALSEDDVFCCPRCTEKNAIDSPVMLKMEPTKEAAVSKPPTLKLPVELKVDTKAAASTPSAASTAARKTPVAAISPAHVKKEISSEMRSKVGVSLLCCGWCVCGLRIVVALAGAHIIQLRVEPHRWRGN